MTMNTANTTGGNKEEPMAPLPKRVVATLLTQERDDFQDPEWRRISNPAIRVCSEAIKNRDTVVVADAAASESRSESTVIALASPSTCAHTRPRQTQHQQQQQQHEEQQPRQSDAGPLKSPTMTNSHTKSVSFHSPSLTATQAIPNRMDYDYEQRASMWITPMEFRSMMADCHRAVHYFVQERRWNESQASSSASTSVSESGGGSSNKRQRRSLDRPTISTKAGSFGKGRTTSPGATTEADAEMTSRGLESAFPDLASQRANRIRTSVRAVLDRQEQIRSRCERPHGDLASVYTTHTAEAVQIALDRARTDQMDAIRINLTDDIATTLQIAAAITQRRELVLALQHQGESRMKRFVKRVRRLKQKASTFLPPRGARSRVPIRSA